MSVEPTRSERPALNPETTLDLSPTVLTSAIGEDYVVLDTRSNKYFGLNESAGIILRGVAHGQCLRQIHETLLATYETSAESAWADLDRVVHELLAAGVIEISR